LLAKKKTEVGFMSNYWKVSLHVIWFSLAKYDSSASGGSF
jgi:hypothetical protein